MAESTLFTKPLNFPHQLQNCIFNGERVLQNLIFIMRSVWHIDAPFCCAVWMLFAAPTAALTAHPSSRGFRPSDEDICRYIISTKRIHQGDGWDFYSLTVDCPPIEPSQYVSVPPKHPDKMGFDEVRILICCPCLPIHYSEGLGFPGS